MVEGATSYCVLNEIQKEFSVSLSHCYQACHVAVIFSVTLFEARTIVKSGISGFSTAACIPFPSLSVALSNVILHLLLVLPGTAHKVQQYPLASIWVIWLFEAEWTAELFNLRTEQNKPIEQFLFHATFFT